MMKSRGLAAVVFIVALVFSGCGRSGLDCQTSADCVSGEACLVGACLSGPACVEGLCPEGYACVEGAICI